MWIVWAVLVVWAAGLAWAKRTQSRRVYKALWAIAAGTMILIGLALCNEYQRLAGRLAEGATMGKQYTQDEARAELAAHGIKYTRADYMAENPVVDHRTYYGQFVDDGVINYVLRGIGRAAILASKDEHFNDIPIRKWDALCGVSFSGSQMIGRVSFPNAYLIGLANITTYSEDGHYSPGVSSSDGVSLLKTAAHIIKDRAAQTVTD